MRGVLAAALGVALLAGCGEAEPRREVDVRQAAELTMADTNRIEMVGPGQRCEGAFDYPRRRYSVDCGDFAEIGIGDVHYARWQGDGWTKSTGDSELMREMAPAAVLGMFRTATDGEAVVALETVRGVSTTRYRLTLDADGRKEYETGAVEVWIAADGRLRRLRGDTPEGTWTIEFYDFGAPVEIEPPPADLVEESTGYGEPPRCDEGSPGPLTEPTVRSAFERRGLVAIIERGCGDSGGMVSGGGLEGVACLLMDGGATDGRTVTEDLLGDVAVLRLANLQCFAEAGDVGALRAAFEELAGSL